MNSHYWKFQDPSGCDVYIRLDQIVMLRPSKIDALTEIVTTANSQVVRGTVDEIMFVIKEGTKNHELRTL